MAITADKEFLIRVKADIQDAVRQMRQMQQATSGQGREAREQQQAVGSLGRSYGSLTAAVAGYVTVSTALRQVRIADEYARTQAQIERTTRAQGDYNAVSRELFEISQRNGVLLKDTVGLFRGIVRSAEQLGATRTDVIEVTNAIQQLAVMGEAGPQQLAGAMLQLQQLFSGVTVQAQEFNSLIDATPDLVDAIARGMGKTRGELILAVRSGEVLVKDVFGAIQREAPRVAEEMRSVPENLTRSSNQLANSWARFIGEANKFNPVGREGMALTQEWAFFMGDMADRLAESGPYAKRLVETSSEGLALRAKEKMLLESIARLQKQALEFEQQRGRANTVLVASIELQKKKLEEVQAKLRPPEQATGGPDAPPAPDPDAENRQRRIESLTKSLAEMAATYSLTAEQVSLYRLRQEGATEADIKAAQASIAVIDAKRRQEQAQRDAETAEREAKQKAREAKEDADRLNAELDAQAQYWRDLVNPANAYQRQLEQIETLYRGGKLSAEEYAEAQARVKEGLDALGQKAEETGDKVDQFAIQAARNIQDALGDTLFNAMRGNFDNIEDAFLGMLQRMVAEALAADINKALFGDVAGSGTVSGVAGNLLTSLFGSVFHSGGIVGSGTAQVRAVSPLAAAMAPRYHAGGVVGLAPDERVGVMKVGEEVLTKSDPRHLFNGGGSGRAVNVNVTMNLPNVRDVETFNRDKDSMLRELSRAIRIAERKI